MRQITAVPAYGRDYKSSDEVLQAYLAGKDFMILPGGQYFNQADANQLIDDGITQIKFLYNKRRNILLHDLLKR